MLAPGRHIEVVSAEFGKGEHSHRESDILFDIEFGEVPILYINEGLLTDIREVLDSIATHGRTAAARDAPFAAIGQVLPQGNAGCGVGLEESARC
jgi:hypothetical protein